jgi:predicted membrane protein (TIGR00267 family)
MAAVALTSKMAERDNYLSELAREKKELKEMPKNEESEIREVFIEKGFSGKILDDIVGHVMANEELCISTMMKEELELKEVKQKEIYMGSFIVGISTLIGSFIPLFLYFFLPLKTALWPSLAVSAFFLFLIGIYKAKVTVGKPFKSGLQMALIGMGAAVVGFLIGRLFGAN